MKNLFVLLLFMCVHVNDSFAQFTLEKVFDGFVQRVDKRWNEDFSNEEDYRSMKWELCRYPLGYFYDRFGTDSEAGTYTMCIYDDNYELHTKETYKFQIPNGFNLYDCKMCYAIMEEPIFLVQLYNNNYKDPIYKFCAYNIEGKMIYDFRTSSSSFLNWGEEAFFENKGKLCFLVQESYSIKGNKTFLYSIDSPSSLVKSMLAKQPAVIVAPDRLIVFSSSGKSEVLKIYTTNGELYDSKALDTEGKTTYMTTGLEKGMYIYDVGGESGKFVVK